MKACIFMGSPNLNGNTATLLKPFVATLKEQGVETKVMELADKTIAGCKGCYVCQHVQDSYGCIQKDDMQAAVELMESSDLIVLATPIYTWYCPGVMKNLLDRHFGLNKYYGKAKGSLWAGKSVAILATHGYEREYACDPFETGIKRLCEHSKLRYLGMYTVRDLDGRASFETALAAEGAVDFALKLKENQW
jgi:multimeric flavodoxin WrbA